MDDDTAILTRVQEAQERDVFEGVVHNERERELV
jgi:hypothetical protein